MIRFISGLLLVISSFLLGLYVSLYVFFFQGLVSVVEGIVMLTNGTTEGVVMMIVFGIIKILLSGVSWWVTFLILYLPGMSLIAVSKY